MPSTEFRSMVRLWFADDFAGKFPAQQVFLRLIVSGQEEAAFRMLRSSFFISAMNCSVVLFPMETALSVRRMWTPTQRGANSFVKESMRFCRAGAGT